MFDYLNLLVTGGPGGLGFALDVIACVGIFAVLDVMALLILSSNSSLKEKFNILGVPLAILFVGLVLGLNARLHNK